MLSAFGLAPRHAKIYIAAIRLGVASVSQIAKTSGVRREDTYKILLKLEKLSLIEMIKEKPEKIRALPPGEGLSILIRNWEEAADEKTRVLRMRKDEFLENFNTLVTKSKLDEEASHFALLLEKDAVIERLKMMVKNAEKEIDASTSAKELPESLAPVSEALHRAAKRGVKIRIILEAVQDKKSFLKNLARTQLPLDIRCANKPMSHYVITDFKNMLIATSPQPSMGRLPYLWTDMASLAELLQRDFEKLWRICPNLQS